jgi:hypothetical protein
LYQEQHAAGELALFIAKGLADRSGMARVAAEPEACAAQEHRDGGDGWRRIGADGKMNLALGVEDVDRGNVPVVGGQAGQHPPDSRDSERVRPLIAPRLKVAC